MYSQFEVSALADALREGLSASSAIALLRERTDDGVEALVRSLVSLRAESADQVMEASLALRPLERSIVEVLLPGLQKVLDRRGPTSAPATFGTVWACDWLRRARRLLPSPRLGHRVLLVEFAGDERAACCPSVRAFELFCLQGGLDVVCAPVARPDALREALVTVEPRVVVLVGSIFRRDPLARAIASSGARSVRAVSHYCPLPAAARDDAGVVLPPSPLQARNDLFALLDELSARLGPDAEPPVSGGTHVQASRAPPAGASIG